MAAKRKWVAMLCAALALTLGLTGCVKVDIKAELGLDNIASIAYGIEVDSSKIPETDMQSALITLNELSRHYSELGYEVSADMDGDVWKIKAVLLKRCDDAGSAAEAFKQMLCDERISPFDAAEFEYNIDEYQSAYYFEGLLDASKAVDKEELGLLPYYTDAAQSAPGDLGVIEVSVPGSQILKGEGGALPNVARASARLSLSEPSQLSVAAVLNGYPGRVLDISLNEYAKELQSEYEGLHTAIICVAALFFILAAVFVLLLLSRPRGRRGAKR